jgi:type VI secretion system protein
MVFWQHSMKASLFECLTGKFLNGALLEDVSEENHYLYSIIDHLRRLFNTRQNQICLCPGYGLPDAAEMWRRLPDGYEDLRFALEQTIKKYEPRIKNPTVSITPAMAPDGKLKFLLKGSFANGSPIHLITTFYSSGYTAVEQWKKQ